MLASVSLSDLSWSTPNGTSLFTNLNLAFGCERVGLVGRNGTGKSTLLRLIAGDLHPLTGHVNNTGTQAMIRQDVIEHPGDTIADLFNVRSALALLDRAEAGIAKAEDLADADWTLPKRVQTALLRCDLSVHPTTPLTTLSGGQRSRAALAALLFSEPDFLLLDEPTNNLDRAGRKAVIDLMRSWKGGAIIASHDRELLEEMDAIVELTSLGVTRYGGNYSAFLDQKATELEAAKRDLVHAENHHAETARRAQQAAERKARRDSAGRKARAKGDQPKILMDAAKERAEASGGAGARLRDSKRHHADNLLSAARLQVEMLQPIHMDMPTTGLLANKRVLCLEGVTGGYNANHPIIRHLSLTITGPERILIAGPNGCGKTTLLKLITGQMTPQGGEVDVMVPFAMLDQHMSLLDLAESLLENFLRLNPFDETNSAHSALARFGFRAGDALRHAGDLSGGERLRAGLACVLGSTPPPKLLILDEPTNHLDLDGIASLEAALAAYDGAVLVVSHDEAFLTSLAPTRVINL
ncbi:MAG: ABC-F family ATP-binding cassette domain-containing protein [Hyphomicrobiales bacterium]|jgi:ATPase subunit of ABC transporter with duplicated ATPase domains